MSTRSRLTVAAAVAVALAASALAPVYADLGWLVRVLGGIAVVAGSGALARAAGLPRLLQPLAATLGLAAYVLVVFAFSTLSYGVLPGTETFRLLGAILDQGLLDVEELGPPVPSRPGLVLLAVLGTGGIAVVVDALAVALRRVAVAGLPLLLLFTVPSAVVPGGLGFLPFVLGAAGWLGLLFADGSDRVSRWGTPLQAAARSSSPGDPGLGRVGRRIGAAALGVAVVVPALLPGLDGRLLGDGVGGAGFGGARTTTTYNPITKLAGQLRLPEPQTLLTYWTDSAADYLRLTTLDVFDEAAGWSSSELSGALDDDAVQQGIPTPQGQTSTGRRRTRTEITVLPRLSGPWLPVPFPPDDIEIDGPWIWDAEAETAFSTRTQVSDLDDPYVVNATPVEPTVELLRQAPAVPEPIRQVYAQPPVLSGFVRQLVSATTAGQSTDYDRVVALQALFRDPANGFRYDNDASAPGINAPDALENFLRGKVGFCEQYSSAMAAMVRSLGIPARVAVGFVPGRALGGNRYEVTTDDAHAWPEVWFAGAGWVRFEPTPRDGEVRTPAYSTPPPASDAAADPAATPSAAPTTPPNAPGTDPDTLDRAAQDGTTGTDGAGGEGGGGAGGGLSPALLVLPMLLLGLAAPALLAAGRRRHRWRAPGPLVASPLVAWDVLHDDAVDLGYRWQPADSPRVAVGRLLASSALPAAGEAALHRLAAAVERARYARPAAPADRPAAPADLGAAPADLPRTPLHRSRAAPADLSRAAPADLPRTPLDRSGAALRRDDAVRSAEVAALRQDVAVVRAGLLTAAGRGARWRARLLPASTLRWASSALGTAVADVLDPVDLALATVRRRVRHLRTAAGRTG
ncbi:MAG: transglutaminaseTgpA domain-containing protein [Mycobacteriales bacterium]